MRYTRLVFIVALSVLPTSLGVRIVSNNFIQLPGAQSEVCHGREVCRYAACVSRSSLIDPRTCIFVASSCHCPDNMACMPKHGIRLRPGYYKHEYACQKPTNFLFRSKLSYPIAASTTEVNLVN